MSFAEAISVERLEPLPGVPNAARLAPFTVEQAATLVPVSPDDPALDMLSSVEQRRYSGHHLPFFVGYADGFGAATWGVHIDEQLVGVTTIRNALQPRVELFLAQEARNQHIGELALAGVIRATFAPGYLQSQSRAVWPRTPWHMRAEIPRGNEAAKRLFTRFGFVYAAHAHAEGEPGFRVNLYDAYCGVVPQAANSSVNRGVRQAHYRLSGFAVAAEGRARIPKYPDHMLAPVVRTPKRYT
jgi:GNAT superfamily N-acetyltransferase